MKQWTHLLFITLSTILSIGQYGNVLAATYLVGPGKTYTKLQDVANLLKEGDTVEVDGNASYPANINLSKNGTKDNGITIRGKKQLNSTRPIITGPGSYGFNITADNIIVQGFEVLGGPKGIGVFGDNIIVRDCIIHGCNHGLVGYGTGTGTVTVEYCEFYNNGISTGGAVQHQIYMATDEASHPGAIFRLQFSYLHDGGEGDNVKSRSQRSEIYYNWIELAGSLGHGLGLFAPDPDDNAGVTVNTAREDADVVGNVIIQNRNACARIGGDAPGYPTNGRYRFVNNTFIMTGTRGDAIRTFNTIESLEMYNNVLYHTQSGADIRIINDADGTWLHSPRSLVGGKNWVMTGATRIPPATEWSNTIMGSSSPFANAPAKNFHPAPGGALVDNGTAVTPTHASYPFQNPLFPPTMQPPQARLISPGAAEPRQAYGVIDIGAFELAPASVRAEKYRNFHGTNVRPRELSKNRIVRIDGKSAKSMKQRSPGLYLVNNSARIDLTQ